MKKILLIAAAVFMSISAMTAQDRPQGPGGERPKQTTPKERAQMQADRLNKELNLTEKQYKKVYKAILNREKEVANLMPQGRPGGMRPGGMRPGGMGSGGVRPPEGMNGQRPRNTEMNSTQEQVKASRERCDKKIKKVLTDEQYAKYEELEAQRQKEMMDRMRNMRGGQNRGPQGQRPQGQRPQGPPPQQPQN